MKNALVLAQKDLSSYFRSWIGTFLGAFFLLIAGIFFAVLIISYAKISLDAQRNAFEGVAGLGLTRFIYSSFFLNLGAVLMFVMPLLTMRSIAEERRHDTLELLYTYPLSDAQIVLGKFLALEAFFILLLLPTLLYTLIMKFLGAEIQWQVVAMGYLGFWFLGTAYLALGLFISSLTDSQVICGIVTFGCLTVFWIMDWIVGVTDGTISQVLAALSPLSHYREFAFGIFDLSHAVYFIFFNFYFLFLALRSVEVRNWKG
jgi:ABC-2 type transport system permease protein